MRFIATSILVLSVVACDAPVTNPIAQVLPGPELVSGNAVWMGFTCAPIAGVAKKDPAEVKRLFEFGYNSGQKFLKGIDNKQDDPAVKKMLNSETPLSMIFIINEGGPTYDFILGRVFEKASDEALKDVINADNAGKSDEHQRLALIKYSDEHCDLIGK